MPDESLSIDQGSEAWEAHVELMADIARDSGVHRTSSSATSRPRSEFVLHGPAEKHPNLLYHNEKTTTAGEMDFTYYSAVYLWRTRSPAKDEKGMKRAAKFLREAVPDWPWHAPSAAARERPAGVVASTRRGHGDDAGRAMAWLPGVAATLPAEVAPTGRADRDIHGRAHRGACGSWA